MEICTSKRSNNIWWWNHHFPLEICTAREVFISYFPVLNFAPMSLLTIRTTDRLQNWDRYNFIFWKTSSENTFQTLLDRIESEGNNRFLPLSFQKESFFYIYKYLLKEVKSRRFRMELSLMGKICFLLLPVRKEII